MPQDVLIRVGDHSNKGECGMTLMNLSIRTDVIVELDMVLLEYPDLEYDEDMSKCMSGLRVKKIDSDKPCSLSVALDIRNRLTELTGIDFITLPPHPFNPSETSDWTDWKHFTLYSFE